MTKTPAQRQFELEATRNRIALRLLSWHCGGWSDSYLRVTGCTAPII